MTNRFLTLNQALRARLKTVCRLQHHRLEQMVQALRKQRAAYQRSLESSNQLSQVFDQSDDLPVSYTASGDGGVSGFYLQNNSRFRLLIYDALANERRRLSSLEAECHSMATAMFACKRRLEHLEHILAADRRARLSRQLTAKVRDRPVREWTGLPAGLLPPHQA